MLAAMETIICDISALDYWRTPPLVQLLLAGDEDVPELRGAINAADVLALRAAIAEEPLCQAMLRPGPSTRNAGAKTKRLRPVIPLLATNQTAPVDILAREHRACHASDIVTPRLWSHDLPLRSCVDISHEVRVATPAFALLQLAGRLDLATLLLIASELCGSFAIFEPCRPIADALQKMTRAGRIPIIGGWEPFVDGSGAVSTLWSRPPLTTPRNLHDMAVSSNSQRGRKRLMQAAKHVFPDAASPFEARAALLFGLPRRLGGEGMNGLALNKKVELSAAARMLAQRECCYCDLYWDEGVDVECQSALVHESHASFLSDSRRTAALQHMGIKTLPITYDQIKSEKQFDALAQTVADLRGAKRKPKTAQHKQAARNLRKQLFIDWPTSRRLHR